MGSKVSCSNHCKQLLLATLYARAAHEHGNFATCNIPKRDLLHIVDHVAVRLRAMRLSGGGQVVAVVELARRVYDREIQVVHERRVRPRNPGRVRPHQRCSKFGTIRQNVEAPRAQLAVTNRHRVVRRELETRLRFRRTKPQNRGQIQQAISIRAIRTIGAVKNPRSRGEVPHSARPMYHRAFDQRRAWGDARRHVLGPGHVIAFPVVLPHHGCGSGARGRRHARAAHHHYGCAV